MSHDPYKVPLPGSNLLGFARRPSKPLPVVEAPAVVHRTVTAIDVFLGRKPRTKQVRGRAGEIVPATMRGRVLAVMCLLSTQQPGKSIKDADIIVGCWRLFPSVFGLSGYDMPDASKSRAKLCGSEGLIQRGMVVRLSEGLYAITPEAQEWWEVVGQEWLMENANHE